MGHGTGAAAIHLPIGLGALPGCRETAAFAAGRVAVAVVFLESDGSKMTSTENWSREIRAAPARTAASSSWPRSRTPSTGGTPGRRTARSSCSCRRRAATARRRRSRPGTSPSTWPVKYGWQGRDVLSDAAWRWEAMAKLGFGHDAARRHATARDAVRRQDPSHERRRLGVRRVRGRQPQRPGRHVQQRQSRSPTPPTSSGRTPC